MARLAISAAPRKRKLRELRGEEPSTETAGLTLQDHLPYVYTVTVVQRRIPPGCRCSVQTRSEARDGLRPRIEA